MTDAVAWAVLFAADGDDLRRMVLFKDHARAEQYAGDPHIPHDEPKFVRALGFVDEEIAVAGIGQLCRNCRVRA
jgi:hypothetical protein